MNASLRASRVLCGLLLACTTGAVHALTAADLQRLLQAGPRSEASYEEVRESPWLSSPVTTRGTLHVTPQGLEKRAQSPKQETWRMLQDRVEWTGPGGARKEILFKDFPALQPLADVTRRAIAGDLEALARDFRIVVSGDERVWSVQMRPQTALVTRQLQSVELQGTGSQLRVLIVTDRQGERTSTRIAP